MNQPIQQALRYFVIVVTILILPGMVRADTLRVVTHNALNFRGTADSDRLDDFRIEMQAIMPDVAVMQEITAEDAVDQLLSFVYLQTNSDWAAAQFVDGRDTDNALFYRTSKVALVSQRQIGTTLRDISEYVLRPAVGDTTIRFRIYSAHLKASEGVDNEERRRQECATLRTQLDLLPLGSHFIMCGDFNLYTSEEPAYQLLLSPTPNVNGQLFDPIDTPGNWHNSVSFASVHTQSPRTLSFGGGATGGMDDRFDFILVSEALMDTNGSYVIPSSYQAFGNDGQHFNRAINDGVNTAVPAEVADALMYASDHLPIVANFVLRSEPVRVTDRPSLPQNHALLTCYPNPFNGALRIEVMPNAGPGTVEIFDLLGRRILSQPISRHEGSPSSFWVDFTGQATGSYIVRLDAQGNYESQRVNFIR